MTMTMMMTMTNAHLICLFENQFWLIWNLIHMLLISTFVQSTCNVLVGDFNAKSGFDVYQQVSNEPTLVRALPVGAAPTKSSFST